LFYLILIPKMDVNEIATKIDETLKDYSVPRRVKEALGRVSKELLNNDKDKIVKITSAVYELEEISNDVNIPMHAKTILWDIISDLEALKEE